jgi:putative ABC transport system substrate-binding protein
VNRRAAALIITLALGILAAPLGVEAQPAGKMFRIGLITIGTPASTGPVVEAFKLGMRDLGYVEGRTLVVEARYAEGRVERLGPLASELLTVNVDVIVTSGPAAGRAVRQITTTTPIVLAIGSDPVEEGLVASLARPGGNITGLAFQNRDLVTKRLQLLKEAIPNVSRVAALWDSTSGVTAELKPTEAAAQALDLQLQMLTVRGPRDLTHAFRQAKTGRAEGLLVLSSPYLTASRRTVVDLASKNQLRPTTTGDSWTTAGSCPMARASPTCSGGLRSMSTGFSKARRPAICRSSSPPNSSS